MALVIKDSHNNIERRTQPLSDMPYFLVLIIESPMVIEIATNNNKHEQIRFTLKM